MAPRPTDFLDIDRLLTDEERLIRDTVRQFVQERVLPYVGEWFEQGILPPELALEVGKLGLFGMHLTGYGCAGASATASGCSCLRCCISRQEIRRAVVSNHPPNRSGSSMRSSCCAKAKKTSCPISSASLRLNP